MTVRSYPLFERIATHATNSPSSKAIVDIPHGVTVTYSELLQDIKLLSSRLSTTTTTTSSISSINGGGEEQRILILCDKGYLVPLTLLSSFSNGSIAVPLLPGLPLPEQGYIASNSHAGLIVCDGKHVNRAKEIVEYVKGENENHVLDILKISLESLRADKREKDVDGLGQGQGEWSGETRAMMLYTSGTTGRPKGVVTRHSALAAQVSAVVQSWQWSPSDNLLHILPLNHLHGIVVALLPTLWAGATVELWERFDGPAIWKRWINEESNDPITMFFGVPTVYSRLIHVHETFSPELQKAATQASSQLRLQVSGSAPLPESVKKIWEKEGGVGGGQVLLERYGMTETGIIAGTGWEVEKRIKGHVGFPMPGVELRLWDEETNTLVTELETAGEVQVRGPPIFQEYWHLPEATAKEFHDGWFKTGDVGVYSSTPVEAKGQLRILGRKSADIIKSGGEKISAVEIERAILELEGMKDCAVVGVDDEEWGQIVSVCLVTTRPDLTVAHLREELRSVLAPYKLPKKLKLYQGEIPRNNMGKVNKKKLVLEAFPES